MGGLQQPLHAPRAGKAHRNALLQADRREPRYLISRTGGRRRTGRKGGAARSAGRNRAGDARQEGGSRQSRRNSAPAGGPPRAAGGPADGAALVPSGAGRRACHSDGNFLGWSKKYWFNLMDL